MLRHWLLLGAVTVVSTLYDQRSNGRGDAHNRSSGSSVVLVVSDGLRWQEVFTGADSAILFGDPRSLGGNGDAIRRKFWRSTAGERRAALMSFLWRTRSESTRLNSSHLVISYAV